MTRVGNSKKYPGMKALFLTKKVAKGQAFACYGGWVYASGDPDIPDDNSYQMSLRIAETDHVLDANGVDESICKGQVINDGLKSQAKCRNRPAPNSAKYCLVYALDDFPIHEEMETCYEQNFWLQKKQWDKLSEVDKVRAGELYGISPSDLIV